MNEKHKRFAEEYVIDLNGKQAAIRTGYSERRAEVTASELLDREDVKAFIKTLQNKLSEATGITAQRVINELAKIGFADIKNYYSSATETQDITTLDNELSAAISSIKITETEGDWGSKTVKEFRLHDKISALTSLGKHLGVFEKDNSQKKPDAIAPETIALIVDKINKNAAS